MANEITRDPLRGLLIADERGTAIWDAESSYTQAGPRAGSPEPTGVSHLALTASGDQTAATTLEALTLRAGVARANPATSAAFVYRAATSGDYWGWDAPSLLARIEPIQWCDTATTDEQYAKNADALALPDGTALFAYELYTTDGAVAQPYQVRVTKRATDGSLSTVNAFTTSFATPTSQGRYPALLLLPSGRVLLYFWVFDPNLNEANVRVLYSDDDGATFSVGQQYALDTPVTYGTGSNSYLVGRIRCAYSLGQVLLLAELTDNDSITYKSTLLQAASLDLGLTLEQVEVWSVSEGPAGVAVMDIPTGFLVTYANGGDSTSSAQAAPLTSIKVGSAYEATSTAAHQAITWAATSWEPSAGISTSNVTDSPGIALTRDGETIYLHYVVRHPSSVDDFAAAIYTTDQGTTWAGLYGAPGTNTPATWIHTETANKVPRYLAGCHVRGSTLIASNFDLTSPAPAISGSLMLHSLGGYSTVTMPGVARWLEPGRRAAFSHTWIPYDFPGNLGWGTSGAGAQALESGYLKITTTSNARQYSITPATNTDQGLLVAFSVTRVSGGALSSTAISCLVSVHEAGPAKSYTVQINVGATGYRVIDIEAGGQVGSDQVITTANGVDFILALGGASVAIWHRARGADLERTWTAGPTSSSLTDGGAGADSIVWGHRTAATAESRWHSFSYAEAAETGANLYDGQTNPDDLNPHPFSAITGSPLAEGVTLRAEGGPAVRGDHFTIATRYDYPVERILPSNAQLSPRWGWRSTSTAAQQIAVQLSTQGDTSLGSDVIAVAAYGSNVPRVQIHGYDAGTSTWVSLGTVDLHTGMAGLRWTREGSTVTVDTGGASTDSPYLHAEEAAGWTFAFSDSIARRVLHNTEGKWTNASQRYPVLTLDGIDGTEGTSGTAGRLIPDAWVVLIDLAGATYSGIRVTIPAPTTNVPAPAESYWELGSLLIGPCVLHGDESGWGRTIDLELGTELSESRDGIRRAYRARDPRRIVEYGWPDGVDTSSSGAPDADPDYLEGSANASALALASRRATPWDVEGLVRRLAGSAAPVVYLPKVDRFGASEGTRVLNRRYQHLLGRVTSDVAIETIQGDELSSEIARISAIRIEEEL